FLHGRAGLGGDLDAVEAAFRLTGYFFTRHVYEPRGIEPPQTRAGFLAALRRSRAAVDVAVNEET
ncbi:MAG: DNA repair protein RecO, partial [Nitratireductor sp.]